MDRVSSGNGSGGMKAKASKTKAVAAPYEPKPREQAAINAWHDRRSARAPSPSIKLTKKDDTTKVDFDHPDIGAGTILMMEALGTTSTSFMDGLVKQLIN